MAEQQGRNIGHLSKYSIISPLLIIGRHRLHTISLNTLSACGVSRGLAQFALCGEHRSHFFMKLK